MKRWYKGNLHSHTTNSDGVWTPEQSAKNYRDAGYSFLCFSDHDLYTDYRRGKYGQTASYEWNSRNREHAKRCIGKYLFTYGKSRA